jgi:hypothetical protein
MLVVAANVSTSAAQVLHLLLSYLHRDRCTVCGVVLCVFVCMLCLFTCVLRDGDETASCSLLQRSAYQYRAYMSHYQSLSFFTRALFADA